MQGRRPLVELTYPSKAALAAVCHKIKRATGRGTTSLRLADVLGEVNPSFGPGLGTSANGVSKRTFNYLGYYAWWRMALWLRRKHPRLSCKQMRRRYFGADRVAEDGEDAELLAHTG